MEPPDFKAVQQKTLKEKLLNPQIPARKPLDRAFVEVVEFLDVPQNETNSIDYIYNKISTSQNTAFEKRLAVIDKSLGLLQKIQVLSNEEKENAKNKEIITISLPDMKIFGELLNFIILEGFYSAFPNGVGIPLERRRLNSFGQASIKLTKVRDVKKAEALLKLLVHRFLQLFEGGGDVRGLLIRGSGYSDMLIGSISLLCNPSSVVEQSEEYFTIFKKVEKLSQTFDLFSIYTLLLQPYSAPWIRDFASKRLSLLPIERQDGVSSLIEFVVGMRESEDINIEKIDHVSRILISKPKSVSSVDYFKNVGDQLFEILVLINQPALTSIAAHVVESIFERNAAIVLDFVFKRIWYCFSPVNFESAGAVLTSEKDLNNAFNVVISLSKKSSPEMLNALFEPLALPLWSYLVYNKKTSREIGPIVDTFVSYFTITENQSALDLVVKNLLSIDGEGWCLSAGPNGLVQIVSKDNEIELSNEEFFHNLDFAVTAMVKILKDVNDDMLNKEFSTILKRWLKVSDTQIESLTADENPFLVLIDLKLLESIVENFKERLSRSPEEMLAVVKNMLISSQSNLVKTKSPENNNVYISGLSNNKDDANVDSDDEDEQDEVAEVSESLKVILELLSAVLSETSIEVLSSNSIETLKELLPPLKAIGSVNSSALALNQRITRLLEGGLPAEKTEEDLDKVSLARAITSINDPLIPIRAHGLYLLRQLIEKKSTAISLDFVIELHLLQLKDPEPYIYLNVIKGLEALLQSRKTETLPLLLSIYRDAKYTLDERLRIGEVLLRRITNSNDTLSGDLSDLITSTTLFVIRIPKEPEQKQDNTLRMSAMSLLGMCCRVCPLGMIEKLEDCFDCVLGILNLETSKDEAIMRRSAIVLVHDLINGPGGLKNVPKSYGKKCLTVLKYISDTDNDLLVREQAKDVLYVINELLKEQFTVAEDESMRKLRI